MSNAEVSIIVPNYKTPYLTKLCLRSLRKYTDCSKIKVIAIDNKSDDESVEYLRSLPWITLIERDPGSEAAAVMHAKALDQAMEQVDTPYVLVIHTDTIVVHDQWLEFLLKKIKQDENIAAVGSWKLETVPPLKAIFKRIETRIRRALGRKILDRAHYFRSHCALYKSDAVRQTRGFYDNESAGISLFNMLKEKNYTLPFIESEELCKYMLHLNHATLILNPAGEGHKTSQPSMRRKLEKKIRSLDADAIMQDDSLDK